MRWRNPQAGESYTNIKVLLDMCEVSQCHKCGHWNQVKMLKPDWINCLLPGFLCSRCGEIWYNQTQSELIDFIRTEKRLQLLQDDVAKWSNETFGSHRPPSAPLHHLKKEVQEVIDNPTDIVEYADCLLLLLDASAKAGFNCKQLLTASFEKLTECKNRKWAQQDENGVSEHVRA